MTFQLIYVRFSKTEFTDIMLIDLLKKSRERNKANGITGILLYSDKVFIQLLEGEKNTVERCYGMILKDSRDTCATILLKETSPFGALFPEWSMGYSHMRFLDLMKIGGLLDNSEMQYMNHQLKNLAASNAARILDSIIKSNNL